MDAILLTICVQMYAVCLFSGKLIALFSSSLKTDQIHILMSWLHTHLVLQLK